MYDAHPLESEELSKTAHIATINVEQDACVLTYLTKPNEGTTRVVVKIIALRRLFAHDKV